MAKWNPRYVCYAKSQGRTPEAQLRYDKTRGSSMAGFILWMKEAKNEFFASSPESFCFGWIDDHEAWDRFLEEKAAA